MKRKSLRVPAEITFIAVFAFLINLWTENDSQTLYDRYFAFIFKWKLPIIIVALLFSSFYIYFREQIREYKEDLADNARMLLQAYDELKDFKWRARLLHAMKRFTQNEPYVLAVQLYEYTVKRERRKVVFKINHLDGYVWENIDLNAMVQAYYEVDARLFQQFEQAVRAFEADFLDPLLDFIQQYQPEIEGKDDIDDRTAIRYAFVQLALDLLETKINFDLFVDPETRRKINTRKRTGILRGIMMKDRFYTFLHDGNSDKQGRVYLTKTIRIKGGNYVFLLTLSPDILEEENHAEHFEKLSQAFAQEMHQAEQITYNNGEID
ncbi:hypothetical protein JQC72_01290 [Polycladomyces sp. WAk]|uniref:Uncharacterized protein n=1 Tax=Polycladomyces zharkentensis TaxID=2807616 RepID=A0ABS2WF46_9BACL|nr:hypothetical protein [Polycladomyces sp. WAk]MBN2908158.1 hypothetical protein [Polycladomyces sp. WAk]